MEFLVGYRIDDDPRFLDYIIDHKDRISEVYFSWRSMKNGRGAIAPSYNHLYAEEMQSADLARLTAAGVGLNLLLNGNCYGAESQSRKLFCEIGDTVEYLSERFKIASVTTSSMLIAAFIKKNFPLLSVRASVNVGVGTPMAAELLGDDFDGYYLAREKNRDLPAIRKMSVWCRENGKTLYMLANSGCFSHCPARTFHDNLVSHEEEIAGQDNALLFKGICQTYLAKEERFWRLLSGTNFVRPEDLSLYEGLFDGVKLATRTNPFPVRVMQAYFTGRYDGAVTDLTEPSHTAALGNAYLDNRRLPADFGEHVAHCDKQCETCTYCREAFDSALTGREE